MKKKTIRALALPAPRPMDLANRIRRLRSIRNEVGLILQAIDDGLQRIEVSPTETTTTEGDRHGG